MRLSDCRLCNQNGYRPWIVSDAVSSRKKLNAKLALSRMEALGASVGPAEMAIYELLGRLELQLSRPCCHTSGE